MKRSKTAIKRLAAMILATLVLLSCVSSALAEAFSAVVASKSMAVYSDAALSKKLGTLQQNDVVRVTGYTNSIAKISYNGYAGFVNLSDLKTVDEVAKKAVLNASAPIYQSPSENDLNITAEPGTRLYVLAVTGEWAQVEKDGYVGFVKVDCLDHADDSWNSTSADSAASEAAEPTPVPDQEVSAPAIQGTVSVDGLKVYQTASTKAQKLGTLKRGQVVSVVKWNSKWAYIELNGKYGYCSVKGLTKGAEQPEATPAPSIDTTDQPDLANAKKGTVTSKKLTVYKTASAKGKKLGTVKKGQEVNVVQTSGKWAYIELNGKFGFCAVSGLSIEDNGDVPTPTASPDTGAGVKATVTAKKVTVYKTASAKGKKLGTLKKGREVNLISWKNGWAYIELNGSYGFCKLSGLTRNDELYSDIPSNFKKESFKATVIRSGALAYATPSTNAQSVSIALGTEVTVAGYTSEWACVVKGSGYAYIPVKMLSRAEYATVNADGANTHTLLKALLSYGYYDGVPSEKYSSAAIAAIKRFQSACGLSQNGVADPGLQRILYGGYAPASSLLSTTLSSGDKGANVTRVQNRLYALGYLSKAGSLDGEYGTTTTAAVKLFQSINGLTGNGKLDGETMKALYSTAAKALPSGLKAGDVITTTNGSYSGNSYLDSVPSGLESTISSYSEGMSNLEKLEYVIYVAQKQLGKPYVWGANGPSKFDCSGLTCYIFKKIGISLNRSAYSQGYDNTYPKIENISDLRRGDAVYFNTVSDSDLSDHAGIYIGNGYFIHASSGGHRVVVSSLFSGAYYNRVFSWGRRILG